MATGTVNWFNAPKGFGFIQPTDGGTDVSFTSAHSSAAGCVTSTKARRSPTMLSRTGGRASRQLPISNQRDEKFADPVAPPLIDATMGARSWAKTQKRPAAALVGEIISYIQVSSGLQTIADD